MAEESVFVSRIREQNSLEYFLRSECLVRLFLKQHDHFVLVCEEFIRHCFNEFLKRPNWLNNVSVLSNNAFNTVTSLSFTVHNPSGIINTINNLLTNVSLSTLLISADVLNINLSIMNYSP